MIIFQLALLMYLCLVAIVGIEGSKREIGAVSATVLALVTTPLIGFIITVLSDKTDVKKQMVSNNATQSDILQELKTQNELLRRQLLEKEDSKK